LTEILKGFEDKRILITGVCGTVGAELIRQLLCGDQYQPLEVVGIDNNESELFFLDQQYLNDSRACFYLVDIRDRDTLNRRMKGIDIVFHVAALKHVVLCERSPYEAVQTNILGVENVIEAAHINAVEKVIFTSSDKAVNPTNVMGTSKLMGERLMTAANSNQRASRTVFSSTRFGNVLGSNGSVIPIFKKQIQQGGPVTLTDRDMTRFVMTIEQAAKLVLHSAEISQGGEVFVTKMPVVRIEDLAKVMITELAFSYGQDPENIEVIVSGTKPGEKLYEELMSDEEIRRALELTDYFAVLPAFRGFYESISYDYPGRSEGVVDNPYNSNIEVALSTDEVKEFLTNHNLLSDIGNDSNQTSVRYWPGDKESR